jgi:multidrug efflux pump subunit AcrB
LPGGEGAMLNKMDWFARPITAVCLFFSILILSLFILFQSESRLKKGETTSFMVTFNNYGMNAAEMERTTAIPIEDKLSSVSGIKNIITISENSRARVYITFKAGSSNSYEAVREIAQRVYETLPSQAQRPVLSSAEESHIPVWMAAIMGSPTNEFIEKKVKPFLMGIEGVGDIDISGQYINEIVVSLDAEKVSSFGIDTAYLASMLSKNDFLYSAGKIKYEGKEIPVIVDGRYGDIDELKEFLIPYGRGKAVKLSQMGDVIRHSRENDVISRVDGEKVTIISITPSSGADISLLSKTINREINDILKPDFKLKILRDLGADETRAFKSVIIASLVSSILVAAVSSLLIKTDKIKSGIISLIVIPSTAIISAAGLSCFGMDIDKKLMTGLAIGIGAATDALILNTERFGNCNNKDMGKKIFATLLPPLLSGGITTIIVLFPLALYKESRDLMVIARALGAVTFTALFISTVILPPVLIKINSCYDLIIKNRQKPKHAILKRLANKGKSVIFNVSWFCIHKAFVVVILFIAMSLCGIAVLVLCGTDVSEPGDADSIYVNIEFKDGFNKEEGDNLLALWAEKINKKNGILSVQTSARIGGGKALIGLDLAVLPYMEARNYIKSVEIPEGFVYFPEISKDEKIWEISIIGDEIEKSRNIAKEIAGIYINLPFVKDVVLNFKEGNPKYDLLPSREQYAKTNIDFLSTANIFRGALYGPVIYKRLNDKGEMDVRLKIGQGNDNGMFDELTNIPFSVYNQSQGNKIIPKAKNYIINKKNNNPSVIRRADRRRVVSISIKTSAMDPRKVKTKTFEALDGFEFPKGYVLEFDRDAIERAEIISGMIYGIILAILFCFIIIAMINESLVLPVVILLTIPPSFSLPVIILGIINGSFNSVAILALIIVSGIVVNSSLITAADFKILLKNKLIITERQIYCILEKRMPSIFATCSTSMISIIPFFFIKDNYSSIINILSVVLFFGIGVSFVTSLILIPSLMRIIYKCRFLNHLA